MTDPGRKLRVTHCPINIAGVPWANVRAQRARGVDARLVVFRRHHLHPEADRSLDLPDGFVRRQLLQFRALARLLPQTDVFHFYFGITLVPHVAQFPILRATGRKSLFHFLGSDIRGKSPQELAYGKRAGAQVVGSYDAIRWVPEAEVIPPGIDLAAYRPAFPDPGEQRPLVVHAPSSRVKKGTAHVVAACAGLDADLEIVEGFHHDDARRRYEAADIVVDQLNSGWHGLFAIEAMALGKPVVGFIRDEARRQTEEAFGLRLPIVSATKETLADVLRELAADPERRRRLGEEGRAYVERVHDIDRVTDRLLDLYARL